MSATVTITRLLLLFATIVLSCSIQAPLESQVPQVVPRPATIPEQVAKGAVSGVSHPPSGPSPSVATLLKTTDVIVTGTIGEPLPGYLSDDQRNVYTDYPVLNPVFAYQAHMMPVSAPGATPTIAITQPGGTINVNGTMFSMKHYGLPKLQPGTQGLFLLQRVGNKYLITGMGYAGAFQIANGKVIPLGERADFAHDFRNMNVSDAVAKMTALVHAK